MTSTDPVYGSMSVFNGRIISANGHKTHAYAGEATDRATLVDQVFGEHLAWEIKHTKACRLLKANELDKTVIGRNFIAVCEEFRIGVPMIMLSVEPTEDTVLAMATYIMENNGPWNTGYVFVRLITD